MYVYYKCAGHVFFASLTCWVHRSYHKTVIIATVFCKNYQGYRAGNARPSDNNILHKVLISDPPGAVCPKVFTFSIEPW